jgi:hypothetical protein
MTNAVLFIVTTLIVFTILISNQVYGLPQNYENLNTDDIRLYQTCLRAQGTSEALCDQMMNTLQLTTLQMFQEYLQNNTIK